MFNCGDILGVCFRSAVVSDQWFCGVQYPSANGVSSQLVMDDV